MTTPTAAPYYIGRIVYAIRAEGHFCGTPMVCISLVDPNALGPSDHFAAGLGELPGIEVMNAVQVAERTLQVLARKFRNCGVSHAEPYPARGAWAYIGGEGAATAELHALVAALQDLGFYVALETDAKAGNYAGAGLDWVCIAANIHGNDTEVNDAVGTADELRFLIYKPTDIDFTIAFCKQFPPTAGQARTVSVQPVGANNEIAKGLCLNQGLAWGWRVSMMAYPLPPADIRIIGEKALVREVQEHILRAGGVPKNLQ